MRVGLLETGMAYDLPMIGDLSSFDVLYSGLLHLISHIIQTLFFSNHSLCRKTYRWNVAHVLQSENRYHVIVFRLQTRVEHMASNFWMRSFALQLSLPRPHPDLQEDSWLESVVVSHFLCSTS
jgi:hypothetical protein